MRSEVGFIGPISGFGEHVFATITVWAGEVIDSLPFEFAMAQVGLGIDGDGLSALALGAGNSGCHGMRMSDNRAEVKSNGTPMESQS